MSKNDITGDRLVSRANTKAFNDNFDRIFGGKTVTLDDDASDNEERRRAEAMLLRKPVLEKNGACHECGDMTAGVFCCPDCRETFEQRARFHNGKK